MPLNANMRQIEFGDTFACRPQDYITKHTEDLTGNRVSQPYRSLH